MLTESLRICLIKFFAFRLAVINWIMAQQIVASPPPWKRAYFPAPWLWDWPGACSANGLWGSAIGATALSVRALSFCPFELLCSGMRRTWPRWQLPICMGPRLLEQEGPKAPPIPNAHSHVREQKSRAWRDAFGKSQEWHPYLSTHSPVPFLEETFRKVNTIGLIKTNKWVSCICVGKCKE